MARTTEDTYLCTYTVAGTTYTFTKVVDIKDFSDLGSDPATVDVTTLSDHQKKYLLGLKNTEKVTCTANYDKTDFATIAGMTGNKNLAIVFGTANGNTITNTDGAFCFTGQVSAYAKGGGVEAAQDMTIVCVVGSQITPVIPQ